MKTSQAGAFLLGALIAVAIIGGVWAYQQSQREVLVDSPALRIETNKATGDTKVDTPFAHVEKDSGGTHVNAPGVQVEVPKKSGD